MMHEIKCPNCGQVFQIEESVFMDIARQVRDEEFDRELKQREALWNRQQQAAVQLARKEAEGELNQQLQKADMQIAQLRMELQSAKEKQQWETAKKLAQREKQMMEKEARIAALQADRQLQEKNAELAVSEAVSQIEKQRDQLQLQQEALKKSYEMELKMKEEQIAYYRDFKARQSTKMIGESLEQHCENEFNKLRATGFQHAYFEKDNDARNGSKGDYIYRERDEQGNDIISIMFEMKNEQDQTATKKKNEDFLKELDKDRNEKHCEYAILVSMLEPDSDLYNTGIVDKSHRYPKMYVIRPQFFIPMITLLRNAAMNTLQVKQQLALVRSQNIDVTHFEENMQRFKDGFRRNYELASKKFQTAIEEIDKTISHLQKTKEALISSENQLRLANNKAEELTIKKLTRNSPSVAARFAELKTEKNDE